MNDFHEPTEYELRRQKKEERREVQRKKLRSRKVKYWIIAALVIVGVAGLTAFGFWFVARRVVPEGPDYSVTYPIQGTEHIAEGSSHALYNS